MTEWSQQQKKKWLKRWYTSINYRHELAKGWEGWKTFALSGKKRKIELLHQGQNWHPDSYPDPPFSVGELHFLPLLQSQPVGKLLTYSSLNLTNLVCKNLVDGIHQWQPGQGSCESLLEEPDMLFESYLGEFPIWIIDGRQFVPACWNAESQEWHVFTSFSILNGVEKNWCCPFKCPYNI